MDFDSNLSHARREFLNRSFGIRIDDCNGLRFDGRYFHHGERIPYENYEEIQLLESKRVSVSNPNIPHIKSWTYMTVDGTVDMRYSNNPLTMTSLLSSVRFCGARSFILSVHTCPQGDNISPIIAKFNKLLAGAKNGNYETCFLRYKTCHDRSHQLSHELLKLSNDIKSYEKILLIQQKLVTLPPDLLNKVGTAADRKRHLESEVRHLQVESKELKEEMNHIVKQVKDQYELEELRKSLEELA